VVCACFADASEFMSTCSDCNTDLRLHTGTVPATIIDSAVVDNKRKK
jgi:hypothetical protein